MHNILVHLEPSSSLDSMLQCALRLAQPFGGYIEGLHMLPGQPDVIAAGADGFVAAAPDLVAGFEREAKERADKARRLFEQFLQEHGLERTGDGRSVSADWRLELSAGHTAIGSRGRIFDLIVMGRPVADQLMPSMAALEAALFDSGRPLLVAPPQPPSDFGRHVVIAWNGSSETASTVAHAMPFITSAEQVTVVTVDRGMVPGPSGAELVQGLERRGLKVDLREVSVTSAAVGEAILAETSRIGGDLLVKGAYTQSRLRQMIFGGATSHILACAELPVIMAH